MQPPLAKSGRVPHVKAELAALFQTALQKAFPDADAVAEVVATKEAKFGNYQCNNAMALFGRLKGKVIPCAYASSLLPACVLPGMQG